MRVLVAVLAALALAGGVYFLWPDDSDGMKVSEEKIEGLMAMTDQKLTDCTAEDKEGFRWRCVDPQGGNDVLVLRVDPDGSISSVDGSTGYFIGFITIDSGGEEKSESSQDPAWTTTVADNLGGARKVAQAYALAKSHGRSGSRIYQAAFTGCRAGQTGQDLPVYFPRDELHAVYQRAVRECSGS